MSKQILTMEDLVTFCKQQKIKKFDANEFGKQICVKVNDMATFEQDDTETNDGFMHLLFKVCHAGENRNSSRISKENLEKYKNTIAYRPVLASIVTSPDDASVLDFNSHDIDIDENDNIIYVEKQVGSFTSDEPYLQYDEKNDKTYLMAHAVIPEEYTPTADIIRRKGGTKVSCEIGIDTMQYNEDTGILDIIDFSFLGVCLLGEHVTEGMAGSRADIESIADFSIENNSVINNKYEQLNNQLIETLEKLNTTISNFNNTTDSKTEGCEKTMNKFEELLSAYGIEVDAIDFKYEGLTDEELEAAFTEKFGTVEEYKASQDTDTDGEPEGGEDKPEGDGTFAGQNFELSHDDIRDMLHALIRNNDNDESYSWVCEVYDNNFIYQKEMYADGDYQCKYFRQGYTKNNSDVTLDGDAEEVFATFVTESERTALDLMKTQYEELKQFKAQVESEQSAAEKNEIFDAEQYAVLADNAKFKQLKADAAKFSVDEVAEKCKVIFAEYVIEKGEFAAGEKKEPKKLGFNFNQGNKRKTAYGGLFED